MNKKKDQKTKFATATQLQAMVKKQVLNRTPDNVAINEIVKFLPDPSKDNTASINAVKANASKKYNQLVEKNNETIEKHKQEYVAAVSRINKDAKEAITTCQEKAKKDVDDCHKQAKKNLDIAVGKANKIILDADKAFDIYVKKVLTIVKGTEFEKKIQGIK